MGFGPKPFSIQPGTITKAMLANAAVARVIIPFWFSTSASIANGASIFAALGGRDTNETTEADVQLTLTAFTMVVREIHVIANDADWNFAMRDDGADVTGTSVTVTPTDTEALATGLSVTVAAGSKVNLRATNNTGGAAGCSASGFIVADVYGT